MRDIPAEAEALIDTDPDLANEVARQLERKPIGGLTIRQRDVLDFIIDYLKKQGVPPVYDEIADGVGLGSKSGVNRILVALEKRGWIARMPGRARSIVVLRVPE
jgi:repressor LexA